MKRIDDAMMASRHNCGAEYEPEQWLCRPVECCPGEEKSEKGAVLIIDAPPAT